MAELLRIIPKDNVAVALSAVEKGAVLTVDGITVTALSDIPAGHKIALCDIKQGENVIKYGFPIGYAKEDVAAGSHIHVHNLHTNLSGELEYTWNPTWPANETAEPATFMGYPRKDGRVGVRNELWILPTVGCVNDIAKALEKEAQSLLGGGVETVYAFPHPYGCSQMGDDQENTRTILANLATPPNVGGVLVLGLGCENSGCAIIEEHMGDYDKDRVRFLISQQVEDEFEEAMKLLTELADNMRNEVRVPCPASKLVIGLKCGGSAGFSGITATPVIGGFSDLLVAQGGTTILTEVPEMFGAETILMDRCKDEETFNKTVSLINDFKAYFIRYNQEVYENPSPGNKAGGITTLEDKSLGCTQKGGTAEVRGVLKYCEPVTEKGLNLVQGPGNDICAITALMGSGAQMVLFTTGRGTPVGAPIPTVKVATNTALAQKKHGWIYYNAGVLVQGATMEETSEDFFKKLLSIASGEKTKSEIHGYRESAIFKDGVTL